MSLYNQPVVLDNGSCSLKAGFAGEERPAAYASSIVGRPKYARVMVGAEAGGAAGALGAAGAFGVAAAGAAGAAAGGGGGVYIGDAAQHNRGLLHLRYPLTHGVVTDWDDMERVWRHCYTQDLRTQPEEHPLLVTEAALNPRANRARMCQVWFEQFGVPCLYVLVQAVLALYALGRTTGVVVDSGDGVSHVVPVYDGFALPQLIKRMDVAGRDVTEEVVRQVRLLTGVRLGSLLEFEIARLLKERCCRVLVDIDRDERAAAAVGAAAADYRLPDGRTLHLGPETFRAPEIIFRPLLIGDESPGLHELAALAIAKTDLDLRPTLYQNIILLGGNTLLRGFGDRMVAELKAGAGAGASAAGPGVTIDRVKVKIYAPPERMYLAWIGGSILAGLLTFKKMWVTLEEYNEDPDVVHRRFM